jgi:hypothetical protein
MRLITVTLAIFLLSIFAVSQAQRGGTFVGSLGLGLTAAQDNFADQAGFSAGSGFGMEGELRFYLWRGFAIGGFVNYMRFGTSYPSSEGRLSFNFSQMGGLAKMNFIRLSKGAIYLTGGGGVFTPNAHYYIPDNSLDRAGDEYGYFGFGGIGLSSKTSMRIIYEFEMRYNVGRADYTIDTIESNVWDFIYAGVKLSFASKGKAAQPRF